MRTMNFEKPVLPGEPPALSGGTADDGQCDRTVVDEAVVFDVMRSGMLNTASGAARVAMRLQYRRCGGRLVAVMLVAGLTEHGTWALRRLTVPVDALRPGQAARALGSIVREVLTSRPDGIALLVGTDGVVRAEVLSRSGRLAWPKSVEVEPRGSDRNIAVSTRSPSSRGRFGCAQRQHA